MQPQTFLSEAAALQDLARRGYRHDYNLSGAQLADSTLDLGLHPAQFHIQEVHRFEGASNPEDACALYALISDSGVKGVVLDAYGPYADSRVTALLRPLALPAPNKDFESPTPRSTASFPFRLDAPVEARRPTSSWWSRHPQPTARLQQALGLLGIG